MTTQPTTPQRWRPRFSIRTLVILVTLVCCYAACWGPTKTRGVEDVTRDVSGVFRRSKSSEWVREDLDPIFTPEFLFRDVSATMPLLIGIDESDLGEWIASTPRTRHYYFWFFGYVAKLPYEQKF